MRWIPGTLFVAVAMLSVACGSTTPPRSGGRITLVEDEADRDRFLIRRTTLDEVLERGPSWFIQRIRVDPVVIDEEFYGFRVRSILPDVEGFDREAIVPGDIVQRVNGQPIGRPEQFMRAWSSLEDAGHISVRILRDGRPMRVTWIVREDAADAGASSP
ncbi:MAG: hypothetical protein ACQEXJ_15010 [Myxococcota bacterium]